MKSKESLKQYQVQLAKLQAEAEAMNMEIINKQKIFSEKTKAVRRIKSKIEGLKVASCPQVSEHALLRYCERVMGVDLEEAKKTILSDRLLQCVETIGGTGKFNLNGFTVVMKDNVVVTIT